MERFSTAGSLLGTWSFGPGFMGAPNGVAVDASGNSFVTDYEQNSMRKFTSSGALVYPFGSFQRPVDVAVNGSGEVFVAEAAGRVQKFSNDGTFLTTIGSGGIGPGQFQSPSGIACDATGRIYVADFNRMRIIRFSANGNFDMEFPVPASPTDVAPGPDGNIYVIRFDQNRVYQYSAAGVLLQSFQSPNGLDGAYRIAINSFGTIFIAEQLNHRITKLQIDRSTAATRTTFGRVKAMYR